jgi:hypothetical protein
MKYRSCAQWPDSVTGLSNVENISYDLHDSWAAADAVCQLLRQHGFGGDHYIFPLECWVEEAEPPIPFSTQLRTCHADGSYGSAEGPEEVMDMAFPTEKYLAYIKANNGKKPTFRLSLCHKFGGICSSGNDQCRVFRGVD